MRNGLVTAVLVCAVSTSIVRAQTIEIIVAGGKHDLKNLPVCVPLSVAKDKDSAELECKDPALKLKGQLSQPGIATESIPPSTDGLVRRDLHFIVPRLSAGQQLAFSCTLRGGGGAGFLWFEQNGDSYLSLSQEGTNIVPPVLRYMHAAYDNSTPDQRNRTYKVFHHLYDPVWGRNRIVTNGGHTDPNTDEKKLLYPHHRGLMYAFNKISYGEGLKQKADTWHAQPGDTHQTHVKVLSKDAGPVLGRHRVLITWHGAKNDVFATEERELAVYNVPGGRLVEFTSRLKTAGGTVRLDGDPQHAGFQFRAANEVAEKTAKQTYFLRPDGKGELGATRNWDPKTKEGPVNLPWDAMSFVLGEQRYTVAYLNSPQNPKESRFSERDYGRFGCYFEYDLAMEHPLVVNYRIWLQNGEMTGEQVQALFEAFAQPPRVTVKKQ
jgi:hypothetical protein